ncbi:MAG: hypothetical protein AAGA85_07610 [Bacteroidota bacterium]
MNSIDTLPDGALVPGTTMADVLLERDCSSFHEACHLVRDLPYGENTRHDDLTVLFDDGQGTCLTKHGVIAALAWELKLPVYKVMGVYGMTEEIVLGADAILKRYDLPYIPMIHCFLQSGTSRVDLTEGNHNGKRTSIEHFIHTERVIPDISAGDRYRIYRKVIAHLWSSSGEKLDPRTLLAARGEALALLKANAAPSATQ